MLHELFITDCTNSTLIMNPFTFIYGISCHSILPHIAMCAIDILLFSRYVNKPIMSNVVNVCCKTHIMILK